MNKYRIQSIRAAWWDYHFNAAYFVTICTKDRICYFGNIMDGKMQLSEIGEIAYKYWLEIPEHFPFVVLGSFVVMPDHVHGIVIINKQDGGNDARHQIPDGIISGDIMGDDDEIDTQNFAYLFKIPIKKNKFGPQSQNLSSIMRGYKTGVKKYATMNQINFLWQSRFHDHIIRNKKSFRRISKYIINNPNTFFV